MKANVQVVAEMELYKQIFLFQLTGTVHFFTCLLMVPNLTGRGSTAIQDIVMSTRSLFSDTDRLDMIKDKIINALLLEMQNDVDFNKLFSDSLFNGLETEYLQDKFLEENMRYVEPLPVKLHPPFKMAAVF
jgi:hypothetical protein